MGLFTRRQRYLSLLPAEFANYCKYLFLYISSDGKPEPEPEAKAEAEAEAEAVETQNIIVNIFLISYHKETSVLWNCFGRLADGLIRFDLLHNFKVISSKGIK